MYIQILYIHLLNISNVADIKLDGKMKIEIKSIKKEKSMKDGYSVNFEINGLVARTYPKKREVVKSKLSLTDTEFDFLIN